MATTESEIDMRLIRFPESSPSVDLGPASALAFGIIGGGPRTVNRVLLDRATLAAPAAADAHWGEDQPRSILGKSGAGLPPTIGAVNCRSGGN